MVDRTDSQANILPTTNQQPTNNRTRRLDAVEREPGVRPLCSERLGQGDAVVAWQAKVT